MRVSLCTTIERVVPPPEVLGYSDITALRSIIYDVDAFSAALDRIPKQVKIGLVLNNECHEVGGDWRGLAHAVDQIGFRFGRRLLYVEIGNELDLWGLPPEFGSDLIKRAAPNLMAHGVPIVLGSVASSDWVNWLQRASLPVKHLLAGVALHPYGQAPDLFDPDGSGQWMFGKLRAAVCTAAEVSGLPVYVTEFGVKLRDAVPQFGERDDAWTRTLREDSQRTYLEKGFRTLNSLGSDVCPFASYFAYTDGIGTASEQGINAFGLLRPDLTPRPAWFGLLGAASTYREDVPIDPAPPPPSDLHFVFGFKDWHDAEPALIGEPTENEYGFAPGVSLQRTTNGTLFWVQTDSTGQQVLGFLVDAVRYRRLAGTTYLVAPDGSLAPYIAPPVPAPVPDPTPAPTPEPVPTPSPTGDPLLDIIVNQADADGLNRTELLAGAIAESDLDPAAARYGTWPDVSFGLYQQTVAFADEGDQSASPRNIALIQQLYSDPAYATRVAAEKFTGYRASERNALDAWCRYNWPARNPFENPNRDNYARGLREAQVRLPDTLAYLPRFDTIFQTTDWTCAPASVAMALESLGRPHGSDQDVAADMGPGRVNASVGLTNANGSGIVSYLQEQGLPAQSAPADWDFLLENAGRFPIMLGGTRWGPAGHWSFVKHTDGSSLILGNPAGTYGEIGTTMTREQFNAIGPSYMVWSEL